MSRNGDLIAAFSDGEVQPHLPTGWCMATTGDLMAQVTSGSRGWAEYYSSHGPIFIRVGNLDHNSISLDLTSLQHVSPPTGAESKRTMARPGDLVISVTADVGMVGVVPDAIGEAYINQHIALCHLNQEVCGSYLAWYLASPNGGQRQFKAMQRGATKAGLGLDDIRAVQVPLAPLAEQRRIVAKIEELFSDLDAGVAALERAKANLKRYRAAVLKAAVEGKLTEKWRAEHPDTEPASALLARILTERGQKWESAQLAKFAAAGREPPKNWRTKYAEPSPPDSSAPPELPNSWCWATTAQLAFTDVGFVFRSNDFAREGIRLLRGENMEPGALRWKDVRYWPEGKLNGFEHFLVKEGEIILAMDRPMISTGLKLARAKASDLPCLLVQRMARLRMIDDSLTEFVYCSMQTQAFINHLLGDQTGTQLPHITGSGIEAFVLPLPPRAEQREITRDVAQRMSIIDEGEREVDSSLARAPRLRQSILKQAFEGKLVPQYPQDESASVLLERIRAALPLPTPSRNGDNARVRGPTRSHPKGGAKRPKGGVG